MNAIRKIGRGWTFAMFFAGALSARAHYCGPPDMFIRVGQTALYSILAESGEPFHIDAHVALMPDTNVAIVDVSSVSDVLNAHFGIIGVHPGTTSIGFYWNNPLNGAGGYCYVVVQVKGAVSGKSSGNSVYVPASTEPVNTATGELFFDEPPDLYLAGPMPLCFHRYYASLMLGDGLSTVEMGNNWRHNFQYHLGLSQDGGNVVIDDERGRTLCFQKTNGIWNLASPLSMPFQLAAQGSNYVLGDPITERLYLFNSAGQLTTISDRLGNQQNLTYTGGALSRVDDNLGRSLRFNYNSDGYLTNVSDGTRAVIFSYDVLALASVIDARGNTNRYLYDTNNAFPGLLVMETRPRGNAPYSQVYDFNGRVATQSDAFGDMWTFNYGSQLTTITNPTGTTVAFAYDASGNMTSYTDENGQTMTMGYDSSARRSLATDRRGKTSAVSFDPVSGKLASRTEADGATTLFSYASYPVNGIIFRELTRISYADGNSQNLTNDPAGNLIALSDRAGNVQTYGLNARGQILLATNTAGGASKFSYNADGTVASITSPAGDVTRLGYDGFRRLTAVTNADGTIRQYGYDPNDALLTTTDERGKVTKAAYDVNGNLSTLTDALGNATQFTYDIMDRLIAVTDPLGRTSRRTYDQLGRINSVTDRNGNGGGLGYDPPGRLLSVTDAAGGIWKRGYDAEGNVITQTDPLGNLQSFLRDSVGRILEMTNPSASTIAVAYDVMGRQKSLRDPLGNVTSLTYDPRALVSGVALTGGAAASFPRDRYGAVAQVVDPNGRAWSLGHDSQGRLTASTDPLGRGTTFNYDSRNRVSQAVFPAELGSASFGYDLAGNLTMEQYSDGTGISYAYDDDSRLVSATGVAAGYDASGNITQINGLAIGRDAGGRVSSITLAAGKKVSYTYDARNLVTAVDDWMGGHTALAYDAAQRLTSISRPNGLVTTFSYSPDSFLMSAQETKAGAGIAGVAVTRDAKGQIVTSSRNYPSDARPPASSVNLTFDAASQVAGYQYDGLGRLLSDGKRNYSWNLASRLTNYTEGATSVSLSYDAFGLLQTRTAGGVTRQYIWNYADGLPSIAVARQAGSDLRYYVRAPNGALLYSVEAAGNQRHFYHFDEMGNATFLTDDSGNITDSYAYTPYGAPIASTGTTDNPFTYGGAFGMMREGATGLYYARTRYYDSTSARFLSRDRLLRSVSPNEVNPYSFNRQNPMSFSDPWGRDARINRDGPDAVHTDFSVDIWSGDKIIGVLTVSFARQGWAGKSGAAKLFELPFLITIGCQGEFTAFFKAGPSIADSPVNGSSVVVKGTREQDERTATAMLQAMGLGNGTDGPGTFFHNLIMNSRTEDGGKRTNINLKPPLPTGDWSTYRLENRTCNTFTTSMLNTYFGRDVGTAVTASGVMENLNALQNPSPVDDDIGVMYVPF